MNNTKYFIIMLSVLGLSESVNAGWKDITQSGQDYLKQGTELSDKYGGKDILAKVVGKENAETVNSGVHKVVGS